MLSSLCIAQILLDNGADRNIREKGWLTPLHVAAYHGSLECARLLLFYKVEDGECGTNINASDRGGHTPLHHAVFGGHLDVIPLFCFCLNISVCMFAYSSF